MMSHHPTDASTLLTGVLAGGIAHDFNNLLTSILGYADLARSEVPHDSLSAKYLDEVIAAARRAAGLTRQLLDYSGKGKMLAEQVQLPTLVREISDSLLASLPRSIQLHFDLDDQPLSVAGDPVQLRQIVLNLVAHAIDAIGPRAGRIDVRTSQVSSDAIHGFGQGIGDLVSTGPYVCLEVSHNGRGIIAEQLPHLFDPYFAPFSKRGMGLAAVQGIVRGHKGTLYVESTPEKGSTFRILLPSDSTAHTQPDATPHNAAQRQNVALVVDDEAGVRQLAKTLCSQLGFTVIEAEDGHQALAAFQANPERFDLVLLDLTMPNLTGHDTFMSLRAIRADVRIILCSGYAETNTMSRLQGVRPAAFLSKPYSCDEFKNVVKKVMGTR